MHFLLTVIFFVGFGRIGQSIVEHFIKEEFNWYIYSAAFWLTQLVIVMVRD